MKQSIVCIVAVVAALASSAATAEGDNEKKGLFLDAGIGASGSSFKSIGLAEDGETKHSGTVGTVRAGYWLHRNWGVSGYYSELGEFEQAYTNGDVFRGDGDSYGVSLMGRLPFAQRWSLVGKINISRTRLKDAGSTLSSSRIGDLTGEKTTAVLPGIELHYSINDRASVFVELDPRGSASKNVDLGYAGLGVRVNF